MKTRTKRQALAAIVTLMLLMEGLSGRLLGQFAANPWAIPLPARDFTFEIAEAEMLEALLEALFAVPPCTNPTIASVSAVCESNLVFITYSQTVSVASATSVANYSVSGLPVASATLLDASNVVLRVADNLLCGNTYALQVADVTNVCGVINPNPSTAYVSCQACPILPDLQGFWTEALTQKCVFTANLKPLIRLKGPFTVMNQGATSAPPTAVAFYLSDDDNLDSTDELLKRLVCRRLDVYQSRTLAFRASIPACTPATNKFIIAVLDATHRITESNTNNNQVVSGPIPIP